jgi:hypothetical protein
MKVSESILLIFPISLCASKEHFQNIQKNNEGPPHPVTSITGIDWRAAIVSGINQTAPPHCEKNKLDGKLLDDLGSGLMCSLYQSETTYPFFKRMSQAEFEVMHAPRLCEFLESTVAPYAWRSSEVISSFHGAEQNFGWDIGLPIVCQAGLALQRAQRDPSKEYQYDPFDNPQGSGVQSRFELILENQCIEAGLLPVKRHGQGRYDRRVNLRHEFIYWLAEKFRRDFLENDPGLCHAPKIRDARELYHGYTYVPRPNPFDNAEDIRGEGYEIRGEEFEIRNARLIRSTAISQVNSLDFNPTDLALDTITAVRKDWEIVWTSNLSEHLWVQDFQIFVYWCPTTLTHRPR